MNNLVQGEEADEQRERPAWLLQQQQQQASSEEREGGSTAAGTPVVGALSVPGSTPSTGRAAANGGPAALLDLLGEGASPVCDGLVAGCFPGGCIIIFSIASFWCRVSVLFPPGFSNVSRA